MIIRLDYSYDGRNFSGSQRQLKARTIQGEIEQALKKLYLEPITLHQSGRTDSGVHALHQVAHFKTGTVIPPDKAAYALSHLLPPDIQLIALSPADDDFHARYSALEKTYCYRISYHDDVFMRPYQLYLDQPLDFSAIDQAIAQLIGQHDFYAFSNRRKGETSTVRTLYDILYHKDNQTVIFRFRGNGFLYKMVRILMQYLIEVGHGRIDPKITGAILASRDKKYTRRVAPAEGLYLEHIKY